MPAGSKPGERRGGRKKGIPNTNTAIIREKARQYGDEALQLHVVLMRDKKLPHDLRMKAAGVILDRAYGKPAQPIVNDEDDAPFKLLMSALDGSSRGLPRDKL